MVCAGDNGRAEFRFEHRSLQLWSAVGRSLVVHDYDNADERFVIISH